MNLSSEATSIRTQLWQNRIGNTHIQIHRQIDRQIDRQKDRYTHIITYMDIMTLHNANCNVHLCLLVTTMCTLNWQMSSSRRLVDVFPTVLRRAEQMLTTNSLILGTNKSICIRLYLQILILSVHNNIYTYMYIMCILYTFIYKYIRIHSISMLVSFLRLLFQLPNLGNKLCIQFLG